MEYITLGQSDLKVSKLCLGCMSYGDPTSGHYSWVLNEKDSRPFIKQALELGINFLIRRTCIPSAQVSRFLGKQ